MDVEWRKQQQLVSSTSTWQVWNWCSYKSPVQDALSWWKTNELGTFLNVRENSSLVFSAYEKGARTKLNSWTIAAKCHLGQVENLGFPDLQSFPLILLSSSDLPWWNSENTPSGLPEPWLAWYDLESFPSIPWSSSDLPWWISPNTPCQNRSQNNMNWQWRWCSWCNSILRKTWKGME